MKFQEWERKNVDKRTRTRLEIPNHLEFENNELMIERYPNLRELYAFSCALEKIEIDAPQLKILNLHDNQLEELNLNDTPLLKSLTVSENNNLKKIIGFERLTNLECLTCFHCSLNKLDCSQKRKLQSVFAADQLTTSQLLVNFQGCDNLEFLDIAENPIHDLDLSNLPKLEDLSLRENGVYVSVGNLSSSADWSSMTIPSFGLPPGSQNVVRAKSSINLENCTSLKYLDFSKMEIHNLNVKNCPSLKGVIGGKTITTKVLLLDIEESEQGKITLKLKIKGPQAELVRKLGSQEEETDTKTFRYWRRITFTRAQSEELFAKIKNREISSANFILINKPVRAAPPRNLATEFWYDPDFWNDRDRFPNLRSIHIDDYEASKLENLDYQERIHQELISRQIREKWGRSPSAEGYDSAYASDEEKEPIINDPSLLIPDHDEHPDKDTAVYLDDSHSNLRGVVIIDGWSLLEELNLGDNYISYLVVKNCPQLHTLRYAHNMMKRDAFIDWASCPNLKPENIDKHNYDGKIYRGYNQDQIREGGGFRKSEGPANERKNNFNTHILQLMIKYLNEELNQHQFLAEISKEQHLFQELLTPFTKEQLNRLISPLSEKTEIDSSYSPSWWPWLGLGMGWISLLAIFIIAKRKNITRTRD